MVESKQNRMRLAATPASTLRKAFNSFQECPHVERINVLDLKEHIVKRVGVQRANRYFAHLVCFLSSRLTKPELDKLVVVTIGKENVALHNQLVKAILSNAVKGKAPPPLPPSPSQHCVKFSSKHQSPSVTSNRTIPHTSPSTLSNGDSFLSSPRSARSTARHSRDRDYRVSPLGHSEAHSAPDLSQPVQQLDVAAKQLDAESNSSLEPPAKRARIECLASDDSGSAIDSEVIGGEESIFLKEEREEILPRLSFGSSIKGSLGLPFCSESRNSGRRPAFCAFPAQFLRQGGLDDDILGVSDLPDGDMMHSLIDQTAVGEGLEGASRECADVLNLALDGYLRRLIKSCGAVAGERAGLVQERTSQGGSIWDKNVNGGTMKLGQGMNGVHMGPSVELVKKDIQNAEPVISLTDFKVALDMNPWQLGNDWTVQLEKISFRIFDQ
eukprot:c18846_g1_i1 orf=733-2055(+)